MLHVTALLPQAVLHVTGMLQVTAMLHVTVSVGYSPAAVFLGGTNGETAAGDGLEEATVL